MKTNAMRKILILLLCVCAFGWSNAQDLTQYNHYIANQGLLNPAYNGTRDVISGLFVHRSQWIGVEGAPMNQALNVHGPIEDTNLGLGVILQNDNIGITNTFDFMGAASYKINVDKNKILSLGLQLGFSSYVSDGSKAVTSDHGDIAYQNKYSKINFNAGFGAYFYTREYFAGLSIPKFFYNEINNENDIYKNTLNFNNVHTYIYGGYVFEWGEVMVKPSLLTRIVPGAPLQFDVSGNVLLMEKLWLGLSYRTTSDLVFLAEYNIDRRFTVRYSFDYTMSSLSNYAQYGSHEIGLQFDFSFDALPVLRSIRYF